VTKPVPHLSSWPDRDYRDRLTEPWGPPMVFYGWPSDVTYRFDGPGGQRMLVWDRGDTSLSAADDATLGALCADLPSHMSDDFDPLGNANAETSAFGFSLSCSTSQSAANAMGWPLVRR
jgi:hypothetical protein